MQYVIVLVGKTMASATGVAEEIAVAKGHDIPVFGVYVGGANDCSGRITADSERAWLGRIEPGCASAGANGGMFSHYVWNITTEEIRQVLLSKAQRNR